MSVAVLREGVSTPRATATLAELKHIPGDDGAPLVGHTLAMLANPRRRIEQFARTYGPIYRSRAFGMRFVSLLGPEANEFVLFDRERLFSSSAAWGPFLGRLFPRGLMLLDFDEHRLHRKALAVAFKSEPMKAYTAALNRGLAEGVAGWLGKGEEIRFYPAIKELTLNLAATCFFGRDLGADAGPLKQAFVDMVAASVSFVRTPLPGTLMARGVRGRAFMVRFLEREVAARREGAGEDLFSHLCRARLDDGRPLTTGQIVDHMSFLMMAAHDTLTSSLTAFVWLLAGEPEWRERLRAEIAALALPRDAPLPYERLDELPLTDMAFKEALRLVPPVPSIPRCTVRETSFGGYRIPAGARVSLNPPFTHRMPEVWPDPETFDPLRFTEENVRARHKYAFVPYGGGAHMCLGLHFATMQAKAFAYRFLGDVEFSTDPGYAPDWKQWPIPQPRDGLPLRIKPLR